MKTIFQLLYWFVGLMSAGFMMMFPIAYLLGDTEGRFIKESDPLNASIIFGIVALWILWTVTDLTLKLRNP